MVKIDNWRVQTVEPMHLHEDTYGCIRNGGSEISGVGGWAQGTGVSKEDWAAHMLEDRGSCSADTRASPTKLRPRARGTAFLSTRVARERQGAPWPPDSERSTGFRCFVIETAQSGSVGEHTVAKGVAAEADARGFEVQPTGIDELSTNPSPQISRGDVVLMILHPVSVELMAHDATAPWERWGQLARTICR